jgi:hypothetical protein
MSFLSTIRTYDRQSEAELDKSMLESCGFTVNLLNHDSAISEFGGMLKIQLQVPDEEAARAASILQSSRPRIEGATERVRKEETDIVRFFGRMALSLFGTWLLAFGILSIVLDRGVGACARFAIGVTILLGWLMVLIVEYLRKKTRNGESNGLQ